MYSLSDWVGCKCQIDVAVGFAGNVNKAKS